MERMGMSIDESGEHHAIESNRAVWHGTVRKGGDHPTSRLDDEVAGELFPAQPDPVGYPCSVSIVVQAFSDRWSSPRGIGS